MSLLAPVHRGKTSKPDGGPLFPMVDLKRLTPADRYREEEGRRKDQFRAGAVFDLGCEAETDYPPVAMRYTVKHDMAIVPGSTARVSSPDKLTRGDILVTVERLDGPVGDRIRDEAGISDEKY